MSEYRQARLFGRWLGLLGLAGLGLPWAALAGAKAPPGPPQVEGSGVVVLWLPDAAPGSVKVKASRGELGPPLQDGALLRLPWTPDAAVGAPLSLELRYRARSGEKIEEQLSLSLAPPEAPRWAEALVLPPNADAISGVEAVGIAPGSLFSSSRGQLRAEGSGVVWRAGGPAKAPAMGLLVAVPPRAVAQPVFVPVAEQLRQSFSQAAPPDSQNTLLMGSLGAIGPQRASPAGTVAFDLTLDPRAPAAELQTLTRDGREERRSLRLPAGERPALLIAPLPEQVADPRRAVPLTVAVLDAEGKPWTGAAPQLTATGAALDAGRSLAPGLYRWDWRPQPGATSVSFTARISGVERQGLVQLRPAPPVVSLRPEPISGKSTGVKLAIALGGPAGAWAGKPPSVELQGAKAAGAVLDRKGGNYELTATLATADGPAWALLQPPPTGGQTPARLLAWAEPLDGGRAALRVAVEDSGGRGVPAQALRLIGPGDRALPGASSGPGGVATSVVSGDGVYTVELGDLRAAVLLDAAGRGQPALWTEEALGAQRRWAEAAPTVSIGRGPAPAVVAAAAPAQPSTGTAGPGPTPAPPTGTPPAIASSTSPSPTSAQSAPAAPAARAPAPAGDGPALRASLSLGAGTAAYTSKQDGFRVGPEQVALTAGGLSDGAGLGVWAGELRLLAFPKGGAWGAELVVEGARTSLSGQYRFPSAETEPIDAALDPQNALSARLGGRYRKAIAGPLSWQALAHLERGQSGVVLWSDGAPTWTPAPLTGLRLGAGLLLDLDRLWLDLHASESFFPYPTQSNVGLGLEVPLQGPLWLRAGLDAQRRSLRFDAGEELIVEERQTVGRLGLGLAF